MVNFHTGTGGREKATDRKAACSNVALLGFKRILLRSDNERTLLSLIELMCSVREIKAREVNDQGSRALETTPYMRSAQRVCVGKLFLLLKTLTEGRSSHARTVQDVTLQEVAPRTKWNERGEVNQEECLKAHRDIPHSRQGQRE